MVPEISKILCNIFALFSPPIRLRIPKVYLLETVCLDPFLTFLFTTSHIQPAKEELAFTACPR